MKNLIVIFSILSLLCVSSCDPKIKSEADQEAIKGDSLDPREGEGEGPVPEEVIK